MLRKLHQNSVAIHKSSSNSGAGETLTGTAQPHSTEPKPQDSQEMRQLTAAQFCDYTGEQNRIATPLCGSKSCQLDDVGCETKTHCKLDTAALPRDSRPLRNGRSDNQSHDSSRVQVYEARSCDTTARSCDTAARSCEGQCDMEQLRGTTTDMYAVTPRYRVETRSPLYRPRVESEIL